MSTNQKVINLDVFSNVAGRALLGGVEHDVLHLNGEEYRLLAGGGSYTVLDTYAIVERIVPSLGAERVYQLSGAQVGRLIAIADGRISDVEAQFPNDSGPVTESQPAPAVPA
jgi:hypothetical protein